MAKVELEFTGRNSVSQVMGQVQKSVKDFGRDYRDVMGSGQQAAQRLAGQFSGELSNSIRGVGNVMQGLLTGGIWGVLGALATTAIGFVVDKFKEAKEAAKKFAEICLNDVTAAIGATKESFTGVSNEIAAVKSEAEGMLAVLNGGVATAAQAKVHELHMQTLQKITDDMSETAKRVVLAQEALETAHINGAAKVEQANNALDLANQKVQLAQQRRTAAETRVAELEEMQSNIMLDGNEVFDKRKQLQQRIVTLEENYANGIISSEDYETRLQKAKLALATFEEEHAPVVKQLTQVEAGLVEAKTVLAQAQAEQDAATRAVTLAEYAKAAAVTGNERANLDLTAALNAATAANNAEIAAKEQKAAEDQKALEAAARQAAADSELENIKLQAIELGVESNEAIRLYNLAINSGYEVATAYAVAQAELNRAVEERAAAETAAKDSGSTGGRSAGRDLVNQIAEGAARGVGGTTVNTSVNTGEVGGGVDKAHEVITLGGLQREVRNDQRKVRDHNSSIKQTSAAMKAFMTGKMSPEVAQKFADKIKEQGLTNDELNSMVKESLKTQLLSKRDVQEQFTRIKSLDERLKKMGLK